MARVFAFGTLKSGFPLHADGLDGARYLGAFRTAERYPMFIAGPWFAPMMLNEPGTGHQVHGELYEVERMTRLDALESVPAPGNFRVLVQLEALDRGQACSAYAYMKSRHLATPVHSDCLAIYDDRRFIPSALR